MTVPHPPPMPGLRDELVQAGARHQLKRRRQRRNRRRAASISTVFGITAAVVFAISAGTGVTPDSAADVRVIDRGDRIDVTLTDLTSRPDEVEQALGDAGLDVEVRSVPVAPSSVGLFITIVSDAPLPDELSDRATGGAFAGFSIPKTWDGHLVIDLGRTAETGETWQGSGNALATGESLECVRMLGLTATDADAIITGRDLTVRWFTYTASAAGEVPADQIDTAPEGAWKVFAVDSTSPDEVWVSLSPDGRSPFQRPAATLPAGCDPDSGP